MILLIEIKLIIYILVFIACILWSIRDILGKYIIASFGFEDLY